MDVLVGEFYGSSLSFVALICCRRWGSGSPIVDVPVKISGSCATGRCLKLHRAQLGALEKRQGPVARESDSESLGKVPCTIVRLRSPLCPRCRLLHLGDWLLSNESLICESMKPGRLRSVPSSRIGGGRSGTVVMPPRPAAGQRRGANGRRCAPQCGAGRTGETLHFESIRRGYLILLSCLSRSSLLCGFLF